MEKKTKVWNMIIKTMANISNDTESNLIGMKQIFNFINHNVNLFPESNGILPISIDEIFLAMSENSDSVELFQLENITNDDVFFTLRDTPKASLKKVKAMQSYGINEILSNRVRSPIFPISENKSNRRHHNDFFMESVVNAFR